jgi:hypothetical protein
LTLKIYSKGERVLRIEVIVHNTRQLHCGRELEKFPEIVCRLRVVLERFADALSCIDACFIADQTLERLPMASRVGKVVVGGIDINKPRMRAVAEAIIALSAASNGFTASELAARVCELGKQTPAHYGPTRAAYDLKKFRGQQIVQRIGQTRRYAVCPAGLKTITALIVLREKAIRPLLAAAQECRPSRGARNPTPLDAHYHDVRAAMRGVFHELGIAA